jgi:hypothetical protein
MFLDGFVFHHDFIHRTNDDSTVDSICLHCLGIVASLPKDLGLEQKENAHSCGQRQRIQLARSTKSMQTTAANGNGRRFRSY